MEKTIKESEEKLDKKTFLQVLLKVQKEMPVVVRNTEAFKYKYAPLEEVWDKVSLVLQDNGFVITNEVSSGGVHTAAQHELGELHSFIPFSNLDLKPQERGSEITYFRRYNLTAMFNIIIAGEDDDATVTTTAKPTTAPVNRNLATGIVKRCEVCNVELPTEVYQYSRMKYSKPLCREHQK